MKKLLLVFGGARIGDTLHILPYIYSHQDYEITWIVGSYEYEVAKFIQYNYPNIKNIISMHDGFPMNIDNRFAFKSRYERYFNHSDFDKVETRIEISTDLTNEYFKKGIDYLPKIKEEDCEPYICYHADSVSKWKQMNNIDGYVLPNIKGITIGGKGERVVKGTEDRTGLSLLESAKIIKNSILFVGIASAMSCLNIYLNHSGICLQFAKDLFKFGDYCSKVKDIY